MTVDADTLTTVNQWAGVIFAVVGAVLTSLAAVRHMSREFLRRIGRGPSVQVQVSEVSGFAGGIALVFTNPAPGSTVDQRLDNLERFGAHAEDQVRRAHLKAARLQEQLEKIQEQVTALRKEVAAAERETARYDGRGLFVVVLGIFLSGVPDQLGVVVSAALIVLGAVWSVGVFVLQAKERRSES